MNLLPVIDRLKTASGDVFKHIGGAAEFDRAIEALIAAPAAFVIEQANAVRDQRGSSTYTATTQTVQVQIGVCIAVHLHQDVSGGADKTPLQEARDAVRLALLGWQPSIEHEPVVYVGGQLLEFMPGVMWWQDSYSTAHLITDRQ
jgi:hypothetical protein